MYKVRTKVEVSAAHHLNLPYESKCNNMHGHNFSIVVEVSSPQLNALGMVADFKLIKQAVQKLDHCIINDVVTTANPTAERLCEWIKTEVELAMNERSPHAQVTMVSVLETGNNEASCEWQYIGAQ